MAVPVVATWREVENTGAHSTTVLCDVPDGTTTGDLLLISAAYGRTVSVPIDLHASFTDSGAGAVGTGNVQMRAMYRIVQAGDPTQYTFAATGSTAGDWVVGLFRITGFDAAAPIDVQVSRTGASTVNPVNDPVTTTGTDRLVMLLTAPDSGSTADSALTTEDTGFPTGTSVNLYHQENIVGVQSGEVIGGAAYVNQAAQGSSGSFTWTINVAEDYASITLAIKPTAVAGATYTQTKFRIYNDDGTGLGPPP